MIYSNQVLQVVALILLVAVIFWDSPAGQIDASDMEGLKAPSESIDVPAPALTDDPIELAESAAPPEVAREATIMDMEGNVLREGTEDDVEKPYREDQ